MQSAQDELEEGQEEGKDLHKELKEKVEGTKCEPQQLINSVHTPSIANDSPFQVSRLRECLCSGSRYRSLYGSRRLCGSCGYRRLLHRGYRCVFICHGRKIVLVKEKRPSPRL